ncbi:Nif3-like dinuclear metal center hexameric protein [Aeromicrobium senzhongii]|uniref:GTP cyclohydrolase 1 type 2 homolog n=1 Tax=Aeromicrobium senzhongii TaxID=2663859 RepID=A0ABX6SWB0_9ACTN|nr:Nif3-like dinuclear metal center hexameric protein [Aeromicrobium senzhongii]MTB87592.1 Nif3-like dinuclear metal center hexameric protein [Aeromicrobium senzhongii]QNL95368.1 Nif3-like dinuclear metal center hexameric protein [Aeromicrobium senzhongii]
MPALRDVIAVLDGLYDPRWADDWDAVGTVAGDPDAEVTSILFAVDPVQAVVDEAVERGAQLVVTHHPLHLKGVTSVAATTPKGRVVHTLISHGIGLHTCHTNADSAPRGVSESMGLALGLTDLRPLETDLESPLDKWVVYVPRDDADRVVAAMHDAGAGRMGDYDHAQYRSDGRGSFRPLAGAEPAIGSVGDVEWVDETRIEVVAEARIRESVRAAMLHAHPYEEVAYDLWPLAARPSDRGSGRIGRLVEPMTLSAFAEHVRSALPSHAGATRIAGDLDRTVETVALCGGSGDFLLGTADAAGADVYVTSDLRHHPVSEHLERPGACAVVDVPHWAAEWTWLPTVAAAVREALGDTVKTHVSTIVTDPWSRTLS